MTTPSERGVHKDASTNILFVVPDLRAGGAERQAIDLANGLDPNRFNKSLVVFENRLDQLDRLDRTCVKLTQFRRQYKFDFSAARQIAELIDRENIEIVHCTLLMAVFMASLAVYRCQRTPKLVAGIHTTINRSFKNDLVDRFLYRYMLRRFHRILFVCRAQRDHWLKKYKELAPVSRVVYNGIDASVFHGTPFVEAGRQFREQLGITDDVSTVACIAGFRPEKGHVELIRAFAALSGAHHLVLAGDGETRPNIEKLVRDLQLTERVHFLGNVADVRPVLAMANLTVLASTAVETFSFAMLESMSMGVPVVATDIGGLAEAIREGETGGLVPPGDPEALAQKMQEFLDSGRLEQMGAAGRNRVANEFSCDKMVEDIQSELLDLVAGGER